MIACSVEQTASLELEHTGPLAEMYTLSPGPLLDGDPARPLIFYNGATQGATWRIGWIAFDAGDTRVVDRGDEPLIVPPPPRAAGDTDIAFASSEVEVEVEVDGHEFLYYSLADKDMMRATARSHA